MAGTLNVADGVNISQKIRQARGWCLRRAAKGKLVVLGSFDVVVAVAYVWFLGFERALEAVIEVHAEYDVGRKVLPVQTDAWLDEVLRFPEQKEGT